MIDVQRYEVRSPLSVHQRRYEVGELVSLESAAAAAILASGTSIRLVAPLTAKKLIQSLVDKAEKEAS